VAVGAVMAEGFALEDLEEFGNEVGALYNLMQAERSKYGVPSPDDERAVYRKFEKRLTLLLSRVSGMASRGMEIFEYVDHKKLAWLKGFASLWSK
jgi:hypothetical protein